MVNNIAADVSALRQAHTTEWLFFKHLRPLALPCSATFARILVRGIPRPCLAFGARRPTKHGRVRGQAYLPLPNEDR